MEKNKVLEGVLENYKEKLFHRDLLSQEKNSHFCEECKEEMSPSQFINLIYPNTCKWCIAEHPKLYPCQVLIEDGLLKTKWLGERDLDFLAHTYQRRIIRGLERPPFLMNSVPEETARSYIGVERWTDLVHYLVGMLDSDGLPIREIVELHIDHIYPMIFFREDEVRECFNWRNLQLLTPLENSSKGDRLVEGIKTRHIRKECYDYINERLPQEYIEFLKRPKERTLF